MPTHALSSPLDSDPPVRWAQYYLSLGWVLSHFPPGTKGPQGKGWNTAAEWLDTRPKVEAQWAKTPTHGMGLIHAGSGTVAIDVDDVEQTRFVFREFGLDLEELLANAPRIRGKRSGRDKAIFRAPEGETLDMHKAVWRHPIDQQQSVTLFELRAGAVHDVLPPSQHPDGHRYEWRTAPWALSRIPFLPEKLLAFWREYPQLKSQIATLAPWAVPVNIPVAPREVADEHNDVIGEFNRSYSVDALLRTHGYERRGTRYLAPSSKSKIPGVSVLEGGRVYSHHGSDVLADGHAHDAFDLFRILEHAGDLRTALQEASTLLDLPVYGERTPALDFSELLARTKPGHTRVEPLAAPTFPMGLLEVPGLVGDIATYIVRTARYPQPILALGAAIAAAATLMGRKVRTESDLRTNVYVLAVADAGAGKEHARQALRTIFDHAGAFNRVSVEALASDAALQTAIVAVPSSLFLLDEIGRFLAVLGDSRAPGHLSEIITQLLKLHSASNGPYCGKIYADADRNTVVQQPNLSLYGTTVPSTLHGAMTTAQVEDGFLSRLLVFESETQDPEPVDRLMEPPPHNLVEACIGWERAPEHSDPANHNLDAVLRPSPRVVAPDAAARLHLARFESEMRERRRQLRAAQQSPALYVRTAATAQKLALIRAAGRRPDEPVIELEDAEWGCQLALFLADSMAWRVLSHVSENLVERNVKRVAKLIQDAGAEGLPKHEITRKTQWLRQSERVDTLHTLATSGQIVVRKDEPKGRGRPGERYIWHTHAEAEPEGDGILSIPSNEALTTEPVGAG